MKSISFAASSVEISPAEWLFIVSFWIVMRLQRMAKSPGCNSTPMAAASNAPLPSYTLCMSYPKIERFATSLPGVNPLGTVLSTPVRPNAANLSIFGVCAYCKSVLLPNDEVGTSAIPSPIIIMCFIITVLLPPEYRKS